MDQCVAFGPGAASRMSFDADRVDAEPLVVRGEVHMLLVDLGAGKDTTTILHELGAAFPFPKNEKERRLANLLGEYNLEVTERAEAALAAGSCVLLQLDAVESRDAAALALRLASASADGRRGGGRVYLHTRSLYPAGELGVEAMSACTCVRFAAGAAGLVSAVTSTVSHAAGALSFDKDYTYRRQVLMQQQASSTTSGVKQGLQAVSLGLRAGASGFINEPVRGAIDAIGAAAPPGSGSPAPFTRIPRGVHRRAARVS